MIFKWLISLAKKSEAMRQNIVVFDDVNKAEGWTHLFWRYPIYRQDEWIDARGKRRNPLPWWFPVNWFVHEWDPDAGIEEAFHDHPRWSITVVLAGELTERTPWAERLLKRGSIVIRSRKYIHAFRIAPEFIGKTWTLFIVGPRKYRQNSYAITPR